MATAKQIAETGVKRIRLDLTSDEAETLAMVCCMVSGDPSKRRGDTDAIMEALDDAGIGDPYPDEFYHCLGLVDEDSSCISFTDKRHPDGHE